MAQAVHQRLAHPDMPLHNSLLGSALATEVRGPTPAESFTRQECQRGGVAAGYHHRGSYVRSYTATASRRVNPRRFIGHVEDVLPYT